jgi:hypothetical protein
MIRKSQPNHRTDPHRRSRRYVQQLLTPQRCIFICIIAILTAGGAFAQNADAPKSNASSPHARAISPYSIDGLALGARIEIAGPMYRGYQCGPSEQFPQFTRCQRTQKQQDWGARRSFESTSSFMHSRDGKAVYINHHIAPWNFDRSDLQNEINRLSSRFGERAREMRLPPREGVANAIIALWGKIELEQLDADAVSILATGESPRKGLLVDYLGNLKRSAQLGLPIFSLSGGAGYLWSASVDRNNRGHVRFLTADASALTPAATEPPSGEIAKTEITPETPTTENVKSEAESASVEEGEKAPANAELAKAQSEEAALPEKVKADLLLARLEADLAASQARSRAMANLASWAIGSLIALLIIAASILLVWRKKTNATKHQIHELKTKPAEPPVDPQGSGAQSPRLESKPSEGRIAASKDAAAPGTIAADAVLAQSGDEKKQEVANADKGRTQEKELVAASEKNKESPQPAAMTSCVHCDREISIDDKFCLHCGASVASRDSAGSTRPCSSCRQEIGAADRFCRHCGASSVAVAAPSMTFSSDGA